MARSYIRVHEGVNYRLLSRVVKGSVKGTGIESNTIGLGEYSASMGNCDIVNSRRMRGSLLHQILRYKLIAMMQNMLYVDFKQMMTRHLQGNDSASFKVRTRNQCMIIASTMLLIQAYRPCMPCGHSASKFAFKVE